MSENIHWEKEEFEDLVARSLIAMYETKLRKHKGALKCLRLTPEILYKVRSVGCYFPPNDRILIINENEDGSASRLQEIDIDNDGRPKYAIMCHAIDDKDVKNSDSMRKNCYLEITFLENIPGLPNPIKSFHSGKAYRTTKIWMRDNHLEGVNQFNVINNEGKIYGTYWTREIHCPISGKITKEHVSPETVQNLEERKNCEDFTTLDAYAAITSYQDRKYLWNVQANEGIAKAKFGVYPEEIKSLFYARELPMTETGRKRPILHWVKAHQRRMKLGIEIDIEKHLRGINEFVYQGTKFIITRPIKIAKIKSDN
jgi:hypothetical protein